MLIDVNSDAFSAFKSCMYIMQLAHSGINATRSASCQFSSRKPVYFYALPCAGSGRIKTVCSLPPGVSLHYPFGVLTPRISRL